MIARSRLPFIVSRFGDRRSSLTCSALSQFPSRTPTLFAPFTLRMPAANSGLSKPVSAASYASRRTAASRRLIVEDDSRRDSSSSRYRSTTVLLKAIRGSEQYHATKSSIANRYDRFDSDDRRVFRTALLAKSKIWQSEDPLWGSAWLLAAHRQAVSLPARQIDAECPQSTGTPFPNRQLRPPERIRLGGHQRLDPYSDI